MNASGASTRPPKIETVLLDAGGVLLDLDYAYVLRLVKARGTDTTVQELSQVESIARTEIERRVQAGDRVSDVWRDYFAVMLAKVGVPAGEHEVIIESLWEAHHRVGLWTVAIPGARQAVREIRDAGYAIGVVSNAEGRVEHDLGSAGFDGLLQTVVDSHVVGVEKPDPGIFKIALDRLGTPPETAIFVGDVPSVDVAGARASGIFPILLDRHDVYPNTDAMRMRSLRELPPWLDKN